MFLTRLQIWLLTLIVLMRLGAGINASVGNEDADYKAEVQAAIKKYTAEVEEIKEEDKLSTELMMDGHHVQQVKFDEDFLEREQEGLTSSAVSGENDVEEGSQYVEDDMLLQNAINELEAEKHTNRLGNEKRMLLEQLTGPNEAENQTDVHSRVKRKVYLGSDIWTDGIIPYVFSKTKRFPNQAEVEGIVKVAMGLWEKNTCLKFVPWTEQVAKQVGHGDYLEFQTHTKCSAAVGRSRPAQFVGLSSRGCSVTGTAHELGHSLGLAHENSRDDRDQHVIFQCWNKADPLDSNQIKKAWPSTINLAKFDFTSAMSYGASSKPDSPLAVKNPELLFLGRLGTLPNFYDHYTVSKLYNCSGFCDESICENDGYMLQDDRGKCRCECIEGLGGHGCTDIDIKSGYTCGDLIPLGSDGTPVSVMSEGFPVPYTSGGKCAWLFTAPKGYVVKITMKQFTLPEKDGRECAHWMEIRNNIIGQVGKKYCGNHWNVGSIDSRGDFNSNQMVVLFDKSDVSVPGGNGFTFEAQAYKDACLNDPCKGAPCALADNEDGYTCDFRSRAFHCHFNEGCLCYFLLKEDVFPVDTRDWEMTDRDPYEGGYSMIARVSRMKKDLNDFAVVRTIPIGFDACVSFAYKLTGGMLQARLYDNGEPSCRLMSTTTVTRDWVVKTYKVIRDPDLYSENDVIQIGFIAQPGGKKGDIYLDDIHVNHVPANGKCVVDACYSDPCHGYKCRDYRGTAQCTYPHHGIWACDFEVGSSCPGLITDHRPGEYKWILTLGPTQTLETGPDGGADKGRYMYMEASNMGTGKRVEMNLEIPFLGVRCLRFKYSMYGRGMGTLNIYHYDPSSSDKDIGPPIWTRSGDQGEGWHNAEVDTAKAGYIRFEGIRGAASVSDMAIDMIKYHPSKCADLPPVSDQVTLAALDLRLSCSFEEGTTCDFMSQSSEDAAEWIIHTGDTPTSQTGAEKAADGIYYAYIETSHMDPETSAILEWSPPFMNGDYCLSLAYSMYGSNTGTLNLYYEDPQDMKRRLIWSLTGEQGEKWLTGSVDVHFHQEGKILFEAFMGPHFHSDIAIDRLVMQKGPCETLGTVPKEAVADKSVYKCGFEYDKACDFMSLSTSYASEWLLRHSKTPTSRTGPTKAGAQNYYVYMEASGKAEHDTAVLTLENPEHKLGTQCLRFMYHMYGSSMGALNVYHGNPSSGTSIWTMEGDQGDQWNHASVIVGGWTSMSTLSIEAVCGSGSHSDIALDQISLEEGGCPEGTTPHAAVLVDDSSFTCDFEDGVFCDGLINEAGTTLQWEVHSGKTPTSGTGPSSAHEGKYYAYFESSWKNPGQSAKMLIDRFFKEGPRCLKFYYHMLGSGMETAQLSVYSEGGEVYFEASKDHGDKWNLANVDIDYSSSDQVVIKAVRGSNYKSDIAIDSIRFSAGKC